MLRRAIFFFKRNDEGWRGPMSPRVWSPRKVSAGGLGFDTLTLRIMTKRILARAHCCSTRVLSLETHYLRCDW